MYRHGRDFTNECTEETLKHTEKKEKKKEKRQGKCPDMNFTENTKRRKWIFKNKILKIQKMFEPSVFYRFLC